MPGASIVGHKTNNGITEHQQQSKFERCLVGLVSKELDCENNMILFVSPCWC